MGEQGNDAKNGDTRDLPERRAGWLLSITGIAIFVASIVLSILGREVTAVAFAGIALVLLLSGAFASRLIKAGRHGIELQSIDDFFDSLSDIDSSSEFRRAVDLLRSSIRRLGEVSPEAAAEKAADEFDKETTVTELLLRSFKDQGWTTEVEQRPGPDSFEVDVIAKKEDWVLYVEVKPSREVLRNSPVVDQLKTLDAALDPIKQGDHERVCLAVGAGRGKPTREEREAEELGFVVVRANVATGNVTGVPQV